jgi:hypothetical protein
MVVARKRKKLRSCTSDRETTHAPPRREALSVFDDVGSSDKRIVLYPGGVHGTSLVDASPFPGRTRALVLRWIEEHG